MATGGSNTEQVGDYYITQDRKNQLGEGAYGTVYLAERVDNKKAIAAAKRVTVAEQYLKDGAFEKEAHMLLYEIPPHRNIVNVYDFLKTEHIEKKVPMVDLWLIMEYCSLGNLAEFAFGNVLGCDQKLDLIYQWSLAVCHLHENRFTHRDIKPENILINGSPTRPIVKLTDFGTARSVIREDYGSVPLNSLSGTCSWMAPEQQFIEGVQLKYNKSVDTYSSGLTALALLDTTKGHIMEPHRMNNKSLAAAMREMTLKTNNYSPSIHNATDTHIEKSIKDIIKPMLSFNPDFRPSMAQVVTQLSELHASCPASPPAKAEANVVSPQLGTTEATLVAKGAISSPAKAEASIVKPKARTSESTLVAKRTTPPSAKAEGSIVKPKIKTSTKPQSATRATAKGATSTSTEKVGTKVTTAGSGAKAAVTVPDDTYIERVLLAAGITSEGTEYKVHKNIVFLDEHEHDSVLTHIPLFADAQAVSVCAAPGGFIASGGIDDTTDSSTSLVQRFNLVDQSWTGLPDMKHSSALHGSICSNNCFFTVGGALFENDECKSCHATVSVLDLNTLEWSELEPLQTAVEGPGITVVDTILMTMGGHDGNECTTQTDKYDMITGERLMCPPMPKPCAPYNRTVAAGTSVFVLHADSKLFMQYNMETNQWTELPCPVKPAWFSAMVLCNHRILVTGGRKSRFGSTTNCIQTYNIDSKTWSVEKQTMPLPLDYHAAFVVRMPVSK